MQNHKVSIYYYHFFFIFFSSFLFYYFFSKQSDFTSVIDFDLVVIHNSIQIVSGEFQDFREHPGFTQFAIYGLFYKLLSPLNELYQINLNEIKSIENLSIRLQNIYVLFRVLNSLILIYSIYFFNKILIEFNVKFFLIPFVLSICLILTTPFFLSFSLLRADIIAILFFLISFYNIKKFIDEIKIKYIFIFSSSMILALLAKIQIIFFFYFLLILFPILVKKEIEEDKKKFFYFDKILTIEIFKIKLNFIILFLSLISLSIIHIFLFNIEGSRFKELPFLDLIIFIILFFSYFFFIKIFDKSKNVLKLSSKFLSYVILFCVIFLAFLNLLSFLNFLKISPEVQLRLINPIYYLSVFAGGNEVSFFEKIFNVLLNYNIFKINLYILCTYLILLMISFFFLKKKLHINIILILFLLYLFICFVFGFRYTDHYGNYLYFTIFLSIGLILNNYKKNFFIPLILIFFLTLMNFYKDINIIKKYIFQESQIQIICSKKNVQYGLWLWARNFDNKFFKKICEERNLESIGFEMKL